MLQYAGLVGGIVTISVIGAHFVAAPPYLWGVNVGLINIGGMVGAVVGFLYTHILSGMQLRRGAKHDGHGHAEPESRLPTMFPSLFIAIAGFFTFDFCEQNLGPNMWVGLEVGYGVIAFGLIQLPSIGLSHVSFSLTMVSWKNPC